MYFFFEQCVPIHSFHVSGSCYSSYLVLTLVGVSFEMQIVVKLEVVWPS